MHESAFHKAEWRMAAQGSVADFEDEFVDPQEGRTLIVGSHVYHGKEDRRKRYADAVGVDMLKGPGVDWVIDLEDPLPKGLGKFAHIECMSVMEHSRRPWLMATNLERLLHKHGSLFVSVPLVWRIHGYPDDYWRMTPSGLQSIFNKIEWDAVRIAHFIVTHHTRIPAVTSSRHPYLARTETVAFGYRK